MKYIFNLQSIALLSLWTTSLAETDGQTCWEKNDSDEPSSGARSSCLVRSWSLIQTKAVSTPQRVQTPEIPESEVGYAKTLESERPPTASIDAQAIKPPVPIPAQIAGGLDVKAPSRVTDVQVNGLHKTKEAAISHSIPKLPKGPIKSSHKTVHGREASKFEKYDRQASLNAHGDSSSMKAALSAQIHLPGRTMEELLQSLNGASLLTIARADKNVADSGSIASLLNSFHTELCKAAEVPMIRVVMTSIFGRFTRESESDFFVDTDSRHGGRSVSPPDPRLGKEVIVRFSVLHETSNRKGYVPKTQKAIIDSIDQALHNHSSTLRTGPLSTLLVNASMTVGNQAKHEGLEIHRIDKFSALALPMGIAAAFVGILIWLASF